MRIIDNFSAMAQVPPDANGHWPGKRRSYGRHRHYGRSRRSDARLVFLVLDQYDLLAEVCHCSVGISASEGPSTQQGQAEKRAEYEAQEVTWNTMFCPSVFTIKILRIRVETRV